MTSLYNIYDIIYPLLTAVLSMSLAQCIKCLLYLLEKKSFQVSWLFSSGGMPSSHSALMAGLSTAIGIHDGWSSSTFFICLVISLIILYDSAGVRHAVGEHSRALDELRNNTPSLQLPKLKEHVGHTPVEVVTGAIIGIGIAIVLQ